MITPGAASSEPHTLPRQLQWGAPAPLPAPPEHPTPQGHGQVAPDPAAPQPQISGSSPVGGKQKQKPEA